MVGWWASFFRDVAGAVAHLDLEFGRIMKILYFFGRGKI
jgi:hypothetical protein